MQTKNTIRYWFLEITAFLLVLVMLYAGVTKLWDHEGFVGEMNHNKLLKDYLPFLSWTVPVGEVLVALLIIIPSARRAGFLVAGITMTLFTGYVAFMMLTQSKLPCTCGGIISALSWKQHLLLNALLTIMGYTAYTIMTKRFDYSNRSSRTPANIVGNH